uniref:exodeoxyribonuclease III n=1 Tax=Chelydra serpentina TaxID=8475 RepID=A0A8C3SHY6_CHESE
MLAPRDFQTFVFFDLETTGLPPDRPRITELCVFALHRRSLLQRPPQDGTAPRLPRVLDRLTLCIDPQQPFTPAAARLTGLSQQGLAENGKRGLDQAVAQTLGGFLARQAPPLCLVAHNGFRYDFPLLRTELARVGAELPPATGCLDTLQAMRELDMAHRDTEAVLPGGGVWLRGEGMERESGWVGRNRGGGWGWMG